jgi:hypothetical protein
MRARAELTHPATRLIDNDRLKRSVRSVPLKEYLDQFRGDAYLILCNNETQSSQAVTVRAIGRVVKCTHDRRAVYRRGCLSHKMP